MLVGGVRRDGSPCLRPSRPRPGVVIADERRSAWTRTGTALFLGLALSACGGSAQNGDSGATTTARTTSAAVDPLVDRGEVELIDDGYQSIEGPQWMPDDGELLFTDPEGDTIFQMAADDDITVFRTPSNYSNGLAIDPQGRLLAAEAGARRLTRTENDGRVTAIAESFEGSRLNQPNDIAVRADGTVYFTDPVFGTATYQAELDFRGVFRIAPGGTLTAERRGEWTEAPNGVALSPDESRLYVSNYNADLVWTFNVSTDGSLSKARRFVTTGRGPDGMAVDAAGNLFVANETGIEVFASDGARWGAIPVPDVPSNCAFGGADGRTLYITAEPSLYRVALSHPGRY